MRGARHIIKPVAARFETSRLHVRCTSAAGQCRAGAVRVEQRQRLEANLARPWLLSGPPQRTTAPQPEKNAGRREARSRPSSKSEDATQPANTAVHRRHAAFHRNAAPTADDAPPKRDQMAGGATTKATTRCRHGLPSLAGRARPWPIKTGPFSATARQPSGVEVEHIAREKQTMMPTGKGRKRRRRGEGLGEGLGEGRGKGER